MVKSKDPFFKTIFNFFYLNLLFISGQVCGNPALVGEGATHKSSLQSWEYQQDGS
jgi:hypothetical protein